MSHNILKDEAAFSADAANRALYEAMTLREVAETLQHNHDCSEPGACADAASQIEVLAEISEEKFELVSDHLGILGQYFAHDAADGPARHDSAAPAVFVAIRNVSRN